LQDSENTLTHVTTTPATKGCERFIDLRGFEIVTSWAGWLRIGAT
jgi:hypothetical protein